MKGRIVGGTLLVTGTTIGAGMLALPVTTALAGFVPSIVLIFLVWLLTAFSAFLILEINLWFKEEVNLVTMAKHVLGPAGAMFTWIVYLLLLYSLTAAYIAGGGPLLLHALSFFLPYQLPSWVGYSLFTVIFGAFIYAGTHAVDWLNRLCMIGLIISYVLLVTWVVPAVQPELLDRKEWLFALGALPVIVTSFGFQMVIPSLTHYLHRNVTHLKWVVWMGTTLPFVVYIIWQYATIGTVPLQGEFGFLNLLKEGKPATVALSSLIGSPLIGTTAQYFAFFSIVTSFLGSSLSLSGFLMDGFKIREVSWGKIATLIMTFIPPLYFVFYFPSAFITALEYAGICFALLLQIMPAVMVWRGRRSGLSQHYKVFGGKPMLCIMLVYSTLIVGTELLNASGLLKG